VGFVGWAGSDGGNYESAKSNGRKYD
jgi:hypothetical protein